MNHMYQVFISYSHTDSAFAKALFRALKRYNPIKEINGKKKLEIFLDESEASNNDLSLGITTALKSSEKMIVICSPSARKSRWVNKEVTLFNEIHGSGNIIPVLLTGDPSTAFPDCFSSIFQEEPWAPDFRSQQSNKPSQNKSAWYHLLSVVYGASRATIERRQFHKKLYTSAIAAIILVAVAIVTFALYHQQREKTSIDLAAQAAVPYTYQFEFEQRLKTSIFALQSADTKQARDIATSLLKAMMLKIDDSLNEKYVKLKPRYVATSGKSDYIFYTNDFGSGVLYNWKINKKTILYKNYQTDLSIFSNDDKYLLVTNGLGNAEIWDVANGKLQTTIQFDSARSDFRDVKLTPDNLSLISITKAYNDTTWLKVWDVASGKLIRAILFAKIPGFFIDSVRQEIVFMNSNTMTYSFQTFLDTKIDTLQIYNYRTGNYHFIPFPIREEEEIKAINFEKRQVLISYHNPYYTPAFYPSAKPVVGQALKDSFAIVQLNPDYNINKVVSFVLNLDKCKSLMSDFPNANVITDNLAIMLKEKYDRLNLDVTHSPKAISPDKSLVIIGSFNNQNPLKPNSPAYAYLFNLNNFTLRDSFPLRQFRYFEKAIFLEKDTRLFVQCSNHYLLFWDLDKRKLLNIDSSSMDDIQLLNDKHYIVGSKTAQYNDFDSIQCSIKKYDYNGDLKYEIKMKNHFYFGPTFLDDSGTQFVTNTRDSIFIWNLNKTPSVLTLPFQDSDERRLLKQDEKIMSANPNRDQLLIVASHWASF